MLLFILLPWLLFVLLPCCQLFVLLPCYCSCHCHCDAVRTIAMLLLVLLPWRPLAMRLLYALLSCYCSRYCHIVVRAIVMLLFVLLPCYCSCFCHAIVRALATPLLVLLPCYYSCYCHAIVRAIAILLFVPLPSYCSSDMFNARFSPRERYCPGPRSKEVRKRGRLYATLYCHHQDDFCIKMDSDENHFNVSFVAILVTSDPVTPPTLVTRHCPMSFGYFRPRHTPNTSDPPLADVFWLLLTSPHPFCDYTQHYIVTMRVISALRWTAMKTILTFHLLPRTRSQLQSNTTVSIHYKFIKSNY